MTRNFDDKFYVDLGAEQIEVSRSCFEELESKGHESLVCEDHPGYFWNCFVLVKRGQRIIELCDQIDREHDDSVPHPGWRPE